MRQQRQTAQAFFLTKKKVGLFLILPPVVFSYFVPSRVEPSRKRNHNCLSASVGTSWNCRRLGREAGKN